MGAPLRQGRRRRDHLFQLRQPCRRRSRAWIRDHRSRPDQPSWRRLVHEVHTFDCRYIIQLHFSGRQRDLPRKEFLDTPPPGATDRPDLLYGLRSRRMSIPEIHELVQAYAAAARRAREAGADGIEIVACNGYILHQFLSSAINDRTDEYNGDLRARERLTLEVAAGRARRRGP